LGSKLVDDENVFGRVFNDMSTAIFAQMSIEIEERTIENERWSSLWWNPGG